MRAFIVQRLSRLAVVTAAALPLQVAVVGGVVATTACRPGPTKVARGMRYDAGEPTYDQFFSAFYETQLLLGQAPERESEARQKLGLAVGAAETDLDTVLAAVDAETQRMAADGLTLSLTVSEPGEPPTAEVKVTQGLPEEKDLRINEAIQEAAESTAKLVADMARAKASVARLKAELPGLVDNVAAAFPKTMTKNDVRRNLDDAQTLIPLMEQRIAEVGEPAQKLLDGLKTSANTTPEPPPEAEAEAEAEAAEESPPPPPKTPPRPKHAPRKPKRAPAPKPKPAADGFEP
jgi:hypothetical protein